MKIAINTLPLYKTKVGMGKYVVELVNRVTKIDKENKYLIYVSNENKHFFNLTSKNVNIQQVPKIFSNPSLRIIWEQLILPFSLWRNSIDVYHALGFVLPLFLKQKIISVVTIADMTFFSHPQHHTRMKQVYFKCMIPQSLRRAKKVITISDNTKKDIINVININANKIKTIYLGVDARFYPQEKETVNAILEKYKIASPYILFVGMLEPRKNVEGLLQAFAMLKDKRKHNLIIVGKKGWRYEELFKLAQEEGIRNDVVFAGYVPDEDLPGLYAGATCFVYPSFYEGFGIPIVEAMACGCPVITSNNSSMQEIAGDAAVLVDPYNKEEIKDAIGSIINNKGLRGEKQRKGLINATKFQWNFMAEETIKVYKNTIQ